MYKKYEKTVYLHYGCAAAVSDDASSACVSCFSSPPPLNPPLPPPCLVPPFLRCLFLDMAVSAGDHKAQHAPLLSGFMTLRSVNNVVAI